MEDFQFSVDLGGMISLLSDHLYSSPDVFLRELIQNGADAISMRENFDRNFSDGKLCISASKGESITFSDNGIGLTEEEIHKFVSVIGQSSKRTDDGNFIGKFGIGLLSCFIVTDEIVMRSRSAKCPEKAVEWHGFADGRYSVKEIEADISIGTEVSFKAAKGCEKYFDGGYIEEMARYFALPLPYPILVSKGEGICVKANLIFHGAASDKRELLLDAGKRIFDTETDFLDVIPLESPTGLFSGSAYILPYTVSAVSSGKRHRIYLKNMLLTEDGSSFLPEWAFFVRCVINTQKLRPTASREDFFHDEQLETAKNEISECIADYLEKLSVTDTNMLETICQLHGVALRSIACENERIFNLFMPYFNFETSFGQISGKYIMEHSGTIFYTSDIDIFRQLRPIFAEQGILLVNSGYVHVTKLLLFAWQLGVADVQPLRENIIDECLNECLDEDKYSFMIEIFNEALKECDCHAVMRNFSPPQLASLYSPNADAEIKHDIERSKENGDELFADLLEAFDKEIDEGASSVLYLNGSNRLINKMSSINDNEKLMVLAKILYVQSLIAGGFPVYSSDMGIMNENLIKLIEWGI